jgi:uncharacterized protein YajQ (UPF0234 family)
MDNAVNQVVKEMLQRYDFKGSKCSLTFDRVEKKIKILADDSMKLKSIHEMLAARMVKRGISSKAVTFGKEEQALGGAIRQEATLQLGLAPEKAREVVRLIKETKLKVQAAIQGEQVRVSSKSKDDLQAVMQMLRNSSIDVPLQFENYR